MAQFSSLRRKFRRERGTRQGEQFLAPGTKGLYDGFLLFYGPDARFFLAKHRDAILLQQADVVICRIVNLDIKGWALCPNHEASWFKFIQGCFREQI